MHMLLKGSGSDETLEQVNYAIKWLIVGFIFSVVALLAGVKAPYGRYSNTSMGGFKVPSVDGRIDWWGHSCSILSVFLVYLYNSRPECTGSVVNLYLVALFIAHYINRGPLFALRVISPKPIPVPILIMTTGFVLLNGWLQGSTLLNLYAFDPNTILEPIFLVGNALFFFGMYTNITCDIALVNLRKVHGPGVYKIPYGGMFDYVSGANFTGECIQWLGFALMCQTPASWTFAFTTVCNIGPRAIHHHQWYLEKFPEYPKERKAFIPYLI